MNAGDLIGPWCKDLNKKLKQFCNQSNLDMHAGKPQQRPVSSEVEIENYK